MASLVASPKRPHNPQVGYSFPLSTLVSKYGRGTWTLQAAAKRVNGGILRGGRRAAQAGSKSRRPLADPSNPEEKRPEIELRSAEKRRKVFARFLVSLTDTLHAIFREVVRL